MSPEQIARVQQSFARLAVQRERVAARFYGRLFEIAPELRPMFGTDIAAQGERLMNALARVVAGLGQFETLRPQVEALALRHAGYGATPQHYALVGNALMWTLQQCIGPDFDAAEHEAWLTTYETLAETMINAAERAAVAA